MSGRRSAVIMLFSATHVQVFVNRNVMFVILVSVMVIISWSRIIYAMIIMSWMRESDSPITSAELGTQVVNVK